jgi:hypothetical protein
MSPTERLSILKKPPVREATKVPFKDCTATEEGRNVYESGSRSQFQGPVYPGESEEN